MRWPIRPWVALLAAGCVARNAPEPRFFRPEIPGLQSSAVPLTVVPPSTPVASGRPLRIWAVGSAPYLRERIVWRSSPVEYGYYEQRRWNELPAVYVEDALISALRRTPGLVLADGLRDPTLKARVVGFEEVLAPQHLASVQVKVLLLDAKRRTLLDQVFSADAAIADDDPITMTRAMGQALADVASAISAATVAALPSPANPER
jgi:ABC-type uncharacterized transport system auxiliary subunit